MSKHTPGPWKVVYEKGAIESVRVEEWGENDLMGDYRGCIIADFTLSHGNRDHAFAEAQANAHLIAAAPTMADYITKRANSGDQEAIEIMEGIKNGST